MKRLLAVLIIAVLIIPTAASIPEEHKAENLVYPYHPLLNVTRVIDLSEGFLANATDMFSINSTREFNAFKLALPAFVTHLKASSKNASVEISIGPTFEVNGTKMIRITLRFDKNLTYAQFELSYYFYNVKIYDELGEKPSKYNAFAVLSFTTLPITKYEYRFAYLNVTFPTQSSPKPELSEPNNASVNLATLYRKFENYTSVPGLDLKAVAEVSKLPYEITRAYGRYQFTSGSKIYVERDLNIRLLGNYPYNGTYTDNDPKTAVRFIYIYLPKSVSELKAYDDLGVLINVTKYPRGDQRRREIKTRTPLVGKISDYHLKIFYELDASLSIKASLETYTPFVPCLVRNMTIEIISPPFGYVSSVSRIGEPKAYYSTGSRHLPVHVVKLEAYNVTKPLKLEVVAYRSLMSYLGMPIIGSIITFLLSIVTIALIRLVPSEEEEAEEMPEEVKEAIRALEELASIAMIVIGIIEKPMKAEERIRALEEARRLGEKRLERALSVINKVKDPELREIFDAVAGMGASIISAIRRAQDLEARRVKLTKSIYLSSIAEVSAFMDSTYKRMMAILVGAKL